MTLTPHFLLAELTTTSTGLPNTPPSEAVCRLRALCSAVLEPWRERVGPLVVTSGYRSAAVNRAVGGSSTSQHLLGEAADVRPRDLVSAWRWLAALAGTGLPVDQAIVYVRPAGVGWVHVSHTARTMPRRELLVQTPEGRYVPWAEWGAAPLVLAPGP